MRSQRGFTLVEVLVALLIMAVLSTMAWQGIDAMSRARESTRQRSEATLRLNTVVAQWEQDLRSVIDTPTAPALAFDGATLRLTRQSPDGVQVVAWSLREGRWLRWISPPVTRAAELQEHWLRSQQLQGTEPGQLVVLDGIEDWEVYYYHGNAWTNAQSTGDVAAAPAVPASGAAPAAREQLPTGVRLVLTFGAPLQGTLNRDVLLGPQQP